MSDNIPKGLIIITHSTYSKVEISEEKVIEALPDLWKPLPRRLIPINPSSLKYGDVNHVYWRELKSRQEKIFKEEVEPLIKKHPDYQIVYFGAATIPMAIHLGYLMQSWHNVKVFLHHHVNKNWIWPTEKFDLGMSVEGLPQDKFAGDGEVVIGVGTSFRIEPEKYLEVISTPVKEVIINAKNIHRDPFSSQEDLGVIEANFLNALDTISNRLPRINSIHLFAAIPVGLAFLLGQQIQANSHPRVHVYEYSDNESPPYQEAFALDESFQEELIISEEDRAKIHEIRIKIEAHFEESVKGIVNNWSDQGKSKHWFDVLFSKEKNSSLKSSYWDNLGGVWKTNLLDTSIELGIVDHVTDQFLIDSSWHLTDPFISSIDRNLGDENKLLQAIRLLIFHEVIHYKFHGMTSRLSSGIGRFPRVLEEADYQADVIAMLHEYSFSAVRNFKTVKKPKKFFVEMIKNSTQTMWAFDLASDSKSMQIRRINRYLIWYFLMAQIKSYCTNLDDILTLISQKPILEIRGIETKTDTEQRYIGLLDQVNSEKLSITVFFQNRIRRYASNNEVLPIEKLIKSFVERDSAAIEGFMEAMVDHLNS